MIKVNRWWWRRRFDLQGEREITINDVKIYGSWRVMIRRRRPDDATRTP